jgi:hypothetical protein
MKQYYFLVGIPRSGNTLLGSILNQNSNISVTANSIVSDMLWKLELERQSNLIYKNFPDEHSFNNVLSGMFDLYYKDWQSNIIIDRSSWGTKNNLELLSNYCPNKPKFIILVRDVVEVLASFIKWSIENPKNFINHETNNASIEDKCDFLMRHDLQIVQEYNAIYNILNSEHKENSLIIEYDNLTTNPKIEIEKIYKFLNISNYEHSYSKLNQFSVNGMSYDDSVVGENLHRVKENGIEKTNYKVSDYLPYSVIHKYSKLNFWRNL